MSDPYARNLLLDPKPVTTAKWSHYANKDIRVQMLTNNRLHVTNNIADSDAYIYTQLQLPAGVYRFGAEVSSPQGAYPTNLLRVVIMPRTELTPATWDGTSGRVVTPANTVPEDSMVEFRVMVGPNANCAVWVRQLFVMTEEDYQNMLSSDITWFDGDSIVRGGGFPLVACIHMWIIALWWWSHEQHRTSEYVHATVPGEPTQFVECGIRAARQWLVAVSGRWQLRAWHGACRDQIDRSGCGRCTRPRLRVRCTEPARRSELRLDVLHAWMRLAAWWHSVRPDWLECVQDRGHDPSQSRVCHPPRRGLDHHSRLCELHGRGLAGHRNATRQRRTADRMVRTTTGRRDRASVSTCAHTLTAISQWEVAA